MNNLHIATYEETCKDLSKVLKVPENKRVVIRMGGTMPYANYPIQINSIKGVQNSTDKLAMKLIFLQNGIPTASIGNNVNYPVVVKGVKRSQGTGVFICKEAKELKKAIETFEKKDAKYYLEEYFPANREFRIHVSKWDGAFFEVEKIRNDGHYGDMGVIKYENHYNIRQFNRPAEWAEMQKAAINALNAQGLDIAAYDLGYRDGKFVVYESNTGPELLKNTLEKYRETLQKYIDGL